MSDAREELEPQQGGDGEDMVGEAAGIGILLSDLLTGGGHKQAVQDIRRFVHGGRDGLCGE